MVLSSFGPSACADYWTDCDLLSFVWVEPSNFTTQLLKAAVFVLAHMD